MGLSSAQGLILLVTASMFAVSLAKTIVVGGSEKWHFGFNYTDWALRNSPFFINDTLVFKYDPPNSTTFPHNVYLLPNLMSFLTCDLRRAKLVADVGQGGGPKGFEFVLRKWQPHYFACTVRDGFHCNEGQMKFFVVPLPHCHGCHGAEIKMGLSSAQGLILLVTASMFAVSLAKTIVVGGSEKWHFGFNYTDWALRNSPFFINDTLVFKYNPPNSTTFPHNVYLLPNRLSFLTCDLRRAKLVADVGQGGGPKGFEFVLRKWQPHYFACTVRDGYHCNEGQMKFFVVPLPRCHGCHG
ncbi:hypothetical protein HHK36_002528 [Tetracentron sinense]|uniref:Phytocyanin domain-containing protein n=1 Tax=Tetracentron sinense TaxID=13715 RepID=A0A835DMV2_TETSI|nr:hypothetical protein HHK36_002528 [Tetracentron sinense]